MDFIEKTINKHNQDYKMIKKFMKRVFPKEQLYPMWGTVLVAKIKKHSFVSYYLNNQFIGIAYNIICKDTVYIFYLAVNDQIQSQGYGSKMIQHLHSKYPDKKFTTLIDTLDPNSKDYETRKKRLEFYNKNGFILSNIKAGIFKPTGDFISTDKNLTVEKCEEIFRKIPCKIFIPK